MLNGPQQYRAHIKGKAHRKRMQRLAPTPVIDDMIYRPTEPPTDLLTTTPDTPEEMRVDGTDDITHLAATEENIPIHQLQRSGQGTVNDATQAVDKVHRVSPNIP